MHKQLFAALAAALFGLNAQADNHQELIIATAGPMTGQYATFGDQMRRGAEMVVADINAAGGVTVGGQTYMLKLEIGDDACDPRQAVNVANELARKGVKFVAGHFCSGSSIPASEVYHEEDILQISPASTNPQLTERGLANVFRTCGRDDQQGMVAGDFIAENFSQVPIAILHDKSTYGQGLAEETRKRLNANGITETMFEAYTAGERDYSALVTRMKEANIGLIYVGGYHTESGLILRQAREQGMNDVVLMGGDALVTSEFWSITGEAGTGTLMTFSPDPAKDPSNAELVARFEAQGITPEGYTLYTYGTVQTYVQAIQMVDSLEIEAVVTALRANQFDTVLGNIGFDEKGDVTAPGYVVYVWAADGSYDYLNP